MREGGVSPLLSEARKPGSETIRTIFCIENTYRHPYTFESTLHCRVHLRSLHGYFVCARGSISRELSIESCKLASCRHSTVPVRAELVTTNCVASYLKERTIVNTIDFRVVGPSPTRSIPGYTTGFRYVDLK